MFYILKQPEWKRAAFMVGTVILLFPILVGAIASSESQRNRYFLQMRRDHLRRIALEQARHHAHEFGHYNHCVPRP